MSTHTNVYYQVMEYMDDDHRIKRRIYTFDNDMDANDMVEFILKRDYRPTRLGVERHETST